MTKKVYSFKLSLIDEERPQEFLFSLGHSQLSYRFLVGLFNLVKNEGLHTNTSQLSKDLSQDSEFEKMSSIFYSRFKIEDMEKYGNLEEAIKNYIAELRRDEFLVPKDLVGDNQEGLTPLSPTDSYLGTLDTLIFNIKRGLKSLREEKIQFWKELLEKYKKDKEAFDYEFKMSKERSAEMERRASKLTPDDFKDLIWDPDSK